MRLHISIIFTIFTILKLTHGQQQFRLQQQPQQFSRDKDLAAEEAAIAYRQYQPQQQYEYDDEEIDESPTTQTNRRQIQQQPYRKGSQPASLSKNQQELEDELVEEEEPDRLALLLEKSTFQCNGRTSGYYADEGLGCEVFHYCQENQKHSWICPEGFSFHQVYLICMPPSGDNICEQSSKYHIVNEYLYKPINVEEHETKPNISLRYSERYYPEDFYHDERHDNHEYSNERRQPIQVGIRKAPTSPSAATPIPYRNQQQLTTIHPQQNVYRSPDEINISLQQRRPQILYSPTTQRYDDDDY